MGQKGWFLFFHPEKVPSAIERYDKETQRIIGVIDAHLSAQGTAYLVGDKATYADLMFVPYFAHFLGVISPELDTSRWEKYSAWIELLCQRPSVKKVLEMAKVESDKMKAKRGV